ncbi:MAG: phosphoglucosamine mutase [Acidobacteriota bacterium]
MKQLFGTDGIRGHAGVFPLDERTVKIIGASLARQFRERSGRNPCFVSGRDTRESGEWIEAALCSGAEQEGAQCLSSGVITTPGIAFLTNEFGMDAGIVISASHNPYEDNGIKVFSPSGKKIDDVTERKIEIDVHKSMSVDVEHNEQLDTSRQAEFCSAYIDHLVQKSRPFERRQRIVIDCANGAASSLAGEVFGRINADLIIINNCPDGRNINAACGSLYLEKLQERVLAEHADIGIAFDGDADRALFVNELGDIVDGDATLWILARYLNRHGKLRNSKVVATVMSNIGLELALRSIGIQLIRSSVGDKYVLEQLLATGAEIGGEQSGHIIFPENSLVGDGMMTALLIMRAIGEQNATLSEATRGFTAFPQILNNVRVREKLPFESIAPIAEAARKVEADLDGHGRLLLRYSGTENLARVMIEGLDQAEIEILANHLADVIRASIG